MPRKIFNFDNQNESKIIESLTNKHLLYKNSISACGCLFFRIHNKKLQLLLIKYAEPNWPRLDDFGGQIDELDNSVKDAISRETSEETNNVITKEFMNTHLIISNSFYNKVSKYYVVVSQVDNDFYPDTNIFGNFEETDKINRTISWFDYDIIKDELAFRLLNNYDLINYLDEINTGIK
jgi:ADP-ribose pyrophosphatase YjhB (NUDIX family)